LPVLLRPETIAEMYRLQLPLDLPRFEDKISPPIGAMQALVFRVGKDAGGHTYAWHSGSVKGTTSEFLNFYADDVVIALHFNYGSGPVDTVAAAHALAALYLPSRQSAARAGGQGTIVRPRRQTEGQHEPLTTFAAGRIIVHTGLAPGFSL
jgi:hypothetical protein